MELNFLWLTIAILAVWRITHLLGAEDGPFDLLVRLRRGVGNGFWGELLDCFHCLSVWVAGPFALCLARDWREWILVWLALSGGACLVQRLGKSNDPPKVTYYEDDPDQ